jgi:hypothetical protein
MQKQLYVVTEKKNNPDVLFFDQHKKKDLDMDKLTDEQKLEVFHLGLNQFNIEGVNLTPVELLREGLSEDAPLTTIYSSVQGGSRKTYFLTLKDHPLKVNKEHLDAHKEFLAYNQEHNITVTAEFVDCDNDWNPL